MTDVTPEVTPEVVAEEPQDSITNQIVEGRFIELSDAGAWFAIADEQKALVPLDELVEVPQQAGLQVPILVDRKKGGTWLASARKARALQLWDELERLAKSGEVVEAEVVGHNEGGLVVDFLGLRAFVPKSQVDLHRVDALEPFVGKRERFAIVKFDDRDGNIVLSRRQVLETESAGMRAEVVEKLAPGQLFEGVVRRVMPYGAFVDIGGVEGLLHNSNMTWGREQPEINAGDTLQVTILEYDRATDKLSLGRKQLLADPWIGIEGRFKDGQEVTGKVVSLAKFGAFVELEEGVEGLVHNSELSWTRRIEHAGSILKRGQEVTVKILGLDLENRRLRLSLKRLEASPWASFAEQHKVGERITVKVARIADFGVFLELTPELDGLLHASDLSWTEKVTNLEERFKPGDTLEVMLLELDPDAGRASLGLKQLSDDPWSTALRIARPGARLDVTITRTTDFGAFATIAEGVEGLIHISELAEERVERAEDVVRPGQTVKALVLAFDAAKKRISLSLKRDVLEDGEGGEYLDDGEATTTLGDLLRGELEHKSAAETKKADAEAPAEPEPAATDGGEETEPGDA